MSIRPLPTELAEKAKKELFEDPNRLNDDLQNIKDWIAKQPHLRARIGRRVHDLTLLRIDPSNCIFENDSLVLWPEFGTKTDTTSYRQSGWRLQSVGSNNNIYPVYWVKALIYASRDRTDDQWLLTFLRGCKFSLERTKEKLDLFYACRQTAPELFAIKHTDPKFNEILELGSYLILPRPKSSYEPALTIIRPGKYDTEKYSITEVIAVANVLVKIVMFEDDNAVISGTRTILDLEGVGFGHFAQMTPTLMKKMVVTTQDALPFRVKGVHYLNTPPGFETIFNAIKSLMTKKNQSRLFVHNKNYEEMYECVPKDVLPTEYGGKGSSVQEIIDYWKKKIQEYSSWLEEDEKYGTDESKRPGKPKTAEEMFGVDGSFRQLQFD